MLISISVASVCAAKIPFAVGKSTLSDAAAPLIEILIGATIGHVFGSIVSTTKFLQNLGTSRRGKRTSNFSKNTSSNLNGNLTMESRSTFGAVDFATGSSRVYLGAVSRRFSTYLPLTRLFPNSTTWNQSMNTLQLQVELVEEKIYWSFVLCVLLRADY